jgi:hypothetical protein
MSARRHPPAYSGFIARAVAVALFTAVAAWSPGSTLAQGGGAGTGDLFGDLFHIKRDPATGQPILQKRDVLLPGDVPGIAYCPIPVDATGAEIPFLPQSCDPDPAFANDMIEVDYFGRLSSARTRDINLRMHFDEMILGIKASETVMLEASGRLRLGTDCTAPGDCATWKTVDSPLENMSTYRRLMKYGHIQTDPLEEDTTPGGDPNEGIVYHPALDAADWGKFFGPGVAALLPSASSSDCFSGVAVNPSCLAPQPLTATDFFLSAAFLAAAADKTGHVTSDLVQYLNRILKITQDTTDTVATLNTVPALVRDENGTIAPAVPGLPPPADERFVDLSPASYLRTDWFSTTVFVLQPAGGGWTPTNVNLLDWLAYINGPMTTTATVMPAFVGASNDALRVVEFLHEYEIPADLWSSPAATITTVAPKTATFRATAQNVELTATVTSGSPTPVGGTVTFYVRTAADIPVGTPVTAAVINGIAAATYVLPGGTTPQTLEVAALFTSTGPFASSLGFGTLTIVPAPTGDVITNGTFDNGLTGWQLFATPDASHIVANVTNGVLQFYWLPAPGLSSQATVYQETGLVLGAGSPLTAQFDLGNSSTVRKRTSVLLTATDFSDRMMCTFWLPANSPLRTYRIQTHTSRAWANTAIYFYASTPGSDGGYYQIDNVSLYPDPTGPTDATYCVDPLAPAAAPNADGPELLTNGDFAAGLAPWILFGQITAQVTAGVLEFVRPAGTPAGVVLQNTAQPLPQAAIVTARFDLGNSGALRKRMTVMLHDGDFTDLGACMFWIEAGQPLSTYEMRAFTTEPWTATTLSLYPATIDDPYARLDNVSMRQTPAVTIVGTECLEPAALAATTASAGVAAARAGAPVPPASPPTGGFSQRREASKSGAGLGHAAIASHAGLQELLWEEPVDLRNAITGRLSFQSRLVSETSTAAVQVSDDFATWHTVLTVPPSADWSPVDVDLGEYAGRIVFLRFVFDTTAPPASAVAPDLWWIDDVRISRGRRPSMARGTAPGERR